MQFHITVNVNPPQSAPWNVSVAVEAPDLATAYDAARGEILQNARATRDSLAAVVLDPDPPAGPAVAAAT